MEENGPTGPPNYAYPVMNCIGRSVAIVLLTDGAGDSPSIRLFLIMGKYSKIRLGFV